MGDADQAVLFIRECLYMDTVIEVTFINILVSLLFPPILT